MNSKLEGEDRILDESLPVLWAGTRGASTRLHRDSYDVNLQVQLVGRKRWALVPKDVNERNMDGLILNERRHPFEESTAWVSGYYVDGDPLTELNTFNDIRELPGAMCFDLAPGDMLFIPKGWYHACICLTDCISINQWLGDPYDRREELRGPRHGIYPGIGQPAAAAIAGATGCASGRGVPAGNR